MANDDLEHYVPIEVESLLPWVESREDDVNQRPSICKVPSILRDLSPDSFRPQLVSIGPLHKQDTNLQDVERLKRLYLRDLLKRPTSPSKQSKTKLEECLQKVKASMAKIKSCYPATIYSDDELANMMVIDGCFILEFCLKVKDSKDKEPTLLNNIQKARIAIDLMLLENQIPFFVLQDIFDLTKPNSISEDLTLLLRKVLLGDVHPFYIPPERNCPRDFSFPNVLKDTNHKHVLDCLHKIYQFESSVIPKEMDMKFVNHCVVELERSGVKFKPQEEKNKAMTMKFVKASSCILWPWRKPNTLVMPKLIIQDYTEVVLRNFIAYEQFFPQANYIFTSYSCFMDKLINDRADIGNLVESKVLIKNLGSHKEAAKMINNLCKNVDAEKFYYIDEIKALDDYYNSFWPNSFAHLRRTYFNSPWNLIALLAGIILFALTVVQTVLLSCPIIRNDFVQIESMLPKRQNFHVCLILYCWSSML